MKTLYTLTLLLPLVLFRLDASANIILFEHANFEGASHSISSDRAYFSDLAWNDQISSIHVPEGWSVVVYEHHFNGASMTLTHDWSVRNSHDFWNDRISSIKVVPPAQGHCYADGYGSAQQVVIFEHGNFGGAQLPVSNHIANLSDWNWNDVVSSIHVPEGWRVIVYEHVGFEGRSTTLRSDWTVYRSTDWWNDRISSIELVPPGGNQRW